MNSQLDTNLTSIKYKLKEIVDYSNLIINHTKLEYTKLEYIESSGTQYIDTGITMNKADSVTIEQECAISNNNYSGTNAYTQWTGNITNNSKCIVKVVYTSSNTTETIYVNDILKSSNSWSSYNGSNNKIGIFKLGDSNNSWHSEAAQSGKLYYCKIIKNNVLVRDFISVKDTNGIPCLYDKVTQEFFYNAGTGDFCFPQQPKQLEYIRSSGTQYINTNVATNTSNLKIDVRYKLLNRTGKQCIVGYNSTYWYFYGSGFGGNNNKFGINYNNNNIISGNNEEGIVNVSITDTSITYNNVIYSGSELFKPYKNSYRILLLSTKRTSDANTYADLYSIKMWSGDNLIRDFVPYKDNIGIVCLYDKITEEYFYNQGTGNFIAGPEIS